MTKEEREAKIAELREAKEKREQEKAARKAEKEKKAQEAANTPKAPKKTAARDLEPVWETQKGENGEDELVNTNLNPHAITCEDCGEIRWVTTSQLHEVTKCKPCARKARRQRRAKAVRAKGKTMRDVVREALELGLFPVEFREKWGLTTAAAVTDEGEGEEDNTETEE